LARQVTETFFLPDEVGRADWTLPADIYNLSHTLFARGGENCVFVPIRSMQYLAVITRDEIVFVDSQAYACRNNEGGRLIMLVWKITTPGRSSLGDPVPCQVIHYHKQSAQIQLRLISAFKEALELLDRRYRNRTVPTGGARIIPLRQ